MTLLEALVSLVILGASAAGFLGVFQNSARSVRSASEWNRASATAQAVLEEAVASAQAGNSAPTPVAGDGQLRSRVELQPWSANLDDVVVHVSLQDGRTLTVHRLVRRR